MRRPITIACIIGVLAATLLALSGPTAATTDPSTDTSTDTTDQPPPSTQPDDDVDPADQPKPDPDPDNQPEPDPDNQLEPDPDDGVEPDPDDDDVEPELDNEATDRAPTVGLPTAVVTLGDSYISGEAGRWEGNHSSDYGDRRSTDRAAYRRGWFWRYAPSRVYGPTGSSGCHRSDVAPVVSSGIEVDARINLACSGATASNLVRAANGGRSLKGEPPQADQLAAVAAVHDVELVVVSIGGNDLGFGAIILDCALDYSLSNAWWSRTCRADQQRNVDQRMEGAMAGVGLALDEIRAVLAEAGQDPGSYRLVLQSYPSPVPSGDEFRYRQGSWSRTFIGGCPFWNNDATWARDAFVPQVAAELAAVAASRGAEFLDLQDALEGREICAEGAAQGDGDSAEWSRYLSTGVLQGEAQESLHPNAFGQQAIGRCLQLLHQAAPGDHRCTNTPGAGPEAMVLEPR